MRHPDFSIILPIYNQADHTDQVVSDHITALENSKYSYEIILVVNDSQDSSRQVCEQIANTNDCVRSIHLDLGGWGRAVRAGLAEARGEIVAYTNSARTSPNDLVLLLIYAAVNQGRVVKANRKIRENFVRRIGSLLYNLEGRALFDLPYWDINGTPKVFPRSFEKLLRLSRNDDLIDLEFMVCCKENSYPMLEVPVFSHRRHGGKSTTNFRSAANMYLKSFQMWMENRRNHS